MLHSRGIITLLVALISSVSFAITFNQTDDFQDGTKGGWGGNRLGTITNIPTGGPTGSDDQYLEVSVTGFHLGTKNTLQWAGDYSMAGVSAVEFDAIHIVRQADEVQLRILVFGAGGAFASVDRAPPLSTNSWTHHTFGLASNDLVYVANSGGTTNLQDTLDGVTSLLIRHDRITPTPVMQHPPHITETIGLDNIHAVPRKPVIANITATSADANLTLNDLVQGQTNVIQTSGNLSSNIWVTVTNFVASGADTNLAVGVTDSNAFFRVQIP